MGAIGFTLPCGRATIAGKLLFFPGAVPHTSTLALTNATLRYAVALADKGWQQACKDDSALAKGLNIVEGKIVFKAVADVFGLPYEPLNL